jgi:hypothetical protein
LVGHDQGSSSERVVQTTNGGSGLVSGHAVVLFITFAPCHVSFPHFPGPRLGS